MKKIILTALAIATMQLTQAQEAKETRTATPRQAGEAPTAEQIATRQTDHLQKILTLTEDQKQKVYQAVLKRATTVQQIKAKTTDRKAMQAEIKPVKEQLIKDVNAVLTPEQQKQWSDFRLQQKQKREARKNQQNSPNGTAAPTKLEPSDDGMKD
ncbi:MAG TPA: hypothetical protein VN698_07935 [Bacteroidia bacterium]|nr:hypothetical protein [Bacteroidia bacterium]